MGQAIVCDRLFIRNFGLCELAAVEEDTCAMFVVVRHVFVTRSVSSLRLVASKLDLYFILFVEPQSISK